MNWFRDKWVTTSIRITVGIALVSAAIGFAWLPSEQPGQRFQGLWDALCSAAGLIRVSPSKDQVVQASYVTTRVEMTPQLLSTVGEDAIGHGATLALRCTMCHGARGVSPADTPNLAGQYAPSIYKQLVDFQTGARASAVMQPLVSNLSDVDMRDLSAYYASLPHERVSQAPPNEVPHVVVSGAPMRSIAPCGACHGEIGTKAGAPWLEGQPLVYLRRELEGFASGTRHNDIGEQMRNVARAMTPEEIDSASRFFANRQ